MHRRLRKEARRQAEAEAAEAAAAADKVAALEAGEASGALPTDADIMPDLGASNVKLCVQPEGAAPAAEHKAAAAGGSA